ncbi:MAG: hypothetical protein RIR10_1217, partial [Planctomycetota bacterium]
TESGARFRASFFANPSMSDLFSWLLSIGSFAGIVLLTALAARSFAGDAAHGRRRCPRCWHELGPNGLRCAECGHLARDENDVSRTRRSPWRGVFALLGVVAIALAARTRFLDRGPWSVAPTSVLLSATPWFADGGYRSAPWELAQRISAGSLDEAQLARAVRVFAEGDSDAPPSSDTWKAKYGQIGRALLLRVPRNDASLLPLIDVPPRISLDVLPGDSTTPLLALDAEVWWPSFVEGRATVKFADGTQREARFEPGGRAPGLLLATTPELLGTMCSVTLSHRIRGSDEAWTDSSPFEIAIPAPRSARPPTAPCLLKQMLDCATPSPPRLRKVSSYGSPARHARDFASTPPRPPTSASPTSRSGLWWNSSKMAFRAARAAFGGAAALRERRRVGCLRKRTPRPWADFGPRRRIRTARSTSGGRFAFGATRNSPTTRNTSQPMTSETPPRSFSRGDSRAALRFLSSSSA